LTSIKATDALAKFLKYKGYSKVFALQGGAVVHILDSLHKYGFDVTYLHHEISCALAAAAYAKANPKSKVILVITTGPGCTNAITGVLGAWQDSVPMLVISGQVRSNLTSYKSKVRQKGTQEVPILNLIKPITKTQHLVKDSKSIIKVFDKMIKISNESRQGPVWIDYPIDFQWPEILYAKPKPKKIKEYYKISLFQKKQINNFVKLFLKSKKPILVLGNGIRSSNTSNYIKKIIKNYQLPFVTTWTAQDLFPTDLNLNLGVIGLYGQEGANKAIFNSDLIICLGTHLHVTHTSTRFGEYAKQAKKVIVNIDKKELKNLNVKFDLKINLDLKFFLKFLYHKLKKYKKMKFNNSNLLNLKTLNWYQTKKTKYINSNLFLNKLSKINKKAKTCYVIDGGGTALYAGFQSLNLKSGNRILCSSAISSMGTGLAETIGVHKAKIYDQIICIIGDGSFLMNIHDLQSIKQYKIPAIIVVVNNSGYLAIRNTQAEFLNKRYFGTHKKWGLEIGSIKKMSLGFGLDYIKIKKNNLDKQIENILKIKKPTVVELVTSVDQKLLFNQKIKDNLDGTFTPMSLEEMAKRS